MRIPSSHGPSSARSEAASYRWRLLYFSAVGRRMRPFLYLLYYGGFIGSVALAMLVLEDIPADSWRKVVAVVVFLYAGVSASWYAGKALGKNFGGLLERKSD